MSFTFNSNIPARNNDPSDDQPLMLTNNQSNRSIWSVDHIGFDNNDGGKHQQVTLVTQNVPVAPTNPESVVYTDIQSGTEFSNSQLYFRNADSRYLLCGVRAFGVINSAAGVLSLGNNYNLSSVAGNSSSFTVDLDSNVVASNDISVQITFSVSGVSGGIQLASWSYSDPTLTVNTSTGNSTLTGKFSIMILQA